VRWSRGLTIRFACLQFVRAVGLGARSRTRAVSRGVEVVAVGRARMVERCVGQFARDE